MRYVFCFLPRRYKTGLTVCLKGKADVVFVGRLFQKNPGVVWSFADDLGVDIRQAGQIEWGFRGRAKPATKKQ